jgi:15-cis-phytoene synthase
VTARVTETLEQAYRTCESITRTQARNFFYGIRLLPPEKRNGLCALYALSRRIDDIGDGDAAADEKATRLADLRAQLHAIEASTDPVLVAVRDTTGRFPVPTGAFDELIDGVEMDVSGHTYATFDELVTYCRCVAGAVGRLCLGVFGSRPDPNAAEYADALGIALQQTNILRDIREDLINGRTYLPQDDLERFDVVLTLDERGALVDPGGRLTALISWSVVRNRIWYDRGWRLLPLLDRRSGACTGAMSGIYRRLLDRIEERPQAVLTRRLSLSGWEKAAVAARALTGTAA